MDARKISPARSPVLKVPGVDPRRNQDFGGFFFLAYPLFSGFLGFLAFLAFFRPFLGAGFCCSVAAGRASSSNLPGRIPAPGIRRMKVIAILC